MANLRIYRLTSTATATALGQAATTIVNKGRIKQICVVHGQSGPGAGTARVSSELAMNNSGNGNSEISSLQSTDVLLARTSCTTQAATASNIAFKVDMDRPVTPGDVLSINILATAAPTANFMAYDVYVMEA